MNTQRTHKILFYSGFGILYTSRCTNSSLRHTHMFTCNCVNSPLRCRRRLRPRRHSRDEKFMANRNLVVACLGSNYPSDKLRRCCQDVQCTKSLAIYPCSSRSDSRRKISFSFSHSSSVDKATNEEENLCDEKTEERKQRNEKFPYEIACADYLILERVESGKCCGRSV